MAVARPCAAAVGWSGVQFGLPGGGDKIFRLFACVPCLSEYFCPMNRTQEKRRLPAEWEPQSAVQLTFPHAGTDWADVLDQVLPCFAEIATIVSRYEKVLVVADAGSMPFR